MKKDFDHFSNNQSSDFYALYNQILKEVDELFESIADNPELNRTFFNTHPWANPLRNTAREQSESTSLSHAESHISFTKGTPSSNTVPFHPLLNL